MALTIDYKSTQVGKIEGSPAKRLDTTESRGRVRYFKGYFKNETGGTIAANSIIALANIDAPGVILPSSKVYVTALGASRTLDVGLQAYKTIEGEAVAESVDGLKDGADVATAGSFNLDDAISGVAVTGPVQVVAKVLGGTMPTNAEVVAHLFVVMD